MIAMATHGRTGLAHILSGSIAEEIVNHSKIPVMTFNIK
jgi:nucleotide-binding universal stress UspA family protein